MKKGAVLFIILIISLFLNGNEGEIHYSYYLPEDYDEKKTYPLMMKRF